jgi:large subunit ribosomal protein L6
MSRIGKKPISIPGGVKVGLEEHRLIVEGPKGKTSQELPREMRILIGDKEVRVERPSDGNRHRALHGLTRTLIANMVDGVTRGFQKELEIVGVGYRVEAKKGGLNFQLGFSHPIFFQSPEGIDFEVSSPTLFRVKGIDKELVGRVADRIRRLRPPEPYKGKGIRYRGEYVRRKAGKTAV